MPVHCCPTILLYRSRIWMTTCYLARPFVDMHHLSPHMSSAVTSLQ
jgi:hypothetical protein